MAGRTQAAVALLAGTLKLDPAGRRSPVRQVIAMACFAAGRQPEALAGFERGLAERLKLPMLHTLRADILTQAGRLEEARHSRAEVWRVQPNFSAAAFGNRFSGDLGEGAGSEGVTGEMNGR